MSRSRLNIVFVVILALVAAACGGTTQPKADAPNPAVSNQPGAVPAAGNTSTPEPTGTPAVAIGDGSRVGQLDANLDRLTSYRLRMTYVRETKGAKGKIQMDSINLAQEIVVASQDEHIQMTTTSAGSSSVGAVETFQIGNTTFVYNPTAQPGRECVTFTTSASAAVNPARLFKPRSVLGGLRSAKLEQKGDSVNGVLADKYSARDKDFDIATFGKARGDIWIAQEGGYVVKFVGEAVNKPESGAGEVNITWDYAIEAANQIESIDLPAVCPPPPPTPTSAQATAAAAPTPRPAEDIPQPPDASGQKVINGIIVFHVPQEVANVSVYYTQTLTAQGWTLNLQSLDPRLIESAWCSTPAGGDVPVYTGGPGAMLILSKDERSLTILITADEEGLQGANVMLMDSSALP